MITKSELKKGAWVIIPLENESGYALGVITHQYKTIRLGYFFNKVYQSSSDIVITGNAVKNDFALIARFSVNKIENASWQLVKTDMHFIKENWPIPTFRMQEPLTEVYYAVVYDETLINESRYKISKAEADKLFAYSLYGYVALEKELTRIFERTVLK